MVADAVCQAATQPRRFCDFTIFVILRQDTVFCVLARTDWESDPLHRPANTLAPHELRHPRRGGLRA